ncbi:MAG: 3'(2'),5'-bisphosphate nucleotidase CysQ [Pelagibacterales bacterium]|nr:3'(2'),5'-bisphosphate nucleotidase CysQ [Pelagibacterales bacterium]OUU62165.1 MAG: hypothetical protein CBC22_05405 [Alphaproteobacteria bacterium TMED62]|tara:strand:- start:902 stop:1675 length:774 start_codon:yes stop_codon:yes gene_type:complete
MDHNYYEKYLFQIIKKCFKELKSIRNIKAEYKMDGSVITTADKKIHNLVSESLLFISSDIRIISEEGNFKEEEFGEKLYWLIDPIDGTKSYFSGGKGYTINIALVKNGNPIIGIIGHPPTNSIWFGSNNIAYKENNGNKVLLKAIDDFNKPTVIISESFHQQTYDFVKKIKSAKIKRVSSSLKFCQIAEGKAHLYPRLHSIKKWDIAAGDAILRAAGGSLLKNNLETYKYNLPNSKTGAFFAVSSVSKWKNTLKKII